MQEFIWALVAICNLILLLGLIKIKNKLSRIYGSIMRKVVLCTLFLAIWSGLNFIRNLSMFQSSIGIMMDLVLYFLATVSFLAGVFFALIALLEMIPGIKRWIGNENDLQFLTKEIANIPLDYGNDQLISTVAQIMADRLLPVSVHVTRSSNSNSLEEIDTTLIQYLDKFEERYTPANLDDQVSVCDGRQCLCRKHKTLILDFCGGGHTYALSFHMKWVGRQIVTPSRYNTIQSIVNTRLQAKGSLMAARASLDISTRQNRLYEIAGQVDDMTTYLKKIFPIISNTISCEYISISVLDSAIQNMYRYSYANVVGRLMERGICYPLKSTIALKAALEKSLLIANSLESDYFRDDYHLYKSGFSSRLVYPLINNNGSVSGVLTLAAVKPRMFNDVEPEDLDFINEPLCRLIEHNRAQKLMRDLKKQIAASFNLTFGLEQQGVPKDFYNQSARLLSETLPATMCRIWGYNQSQNRLEPLGQHDLHDNSSNSDGIPGHVGLELLPCHKNVIEMGKAMIVNQSNPNTNMDEGEVRAIGLSGVKSAILAPMKLKNRIMGIISVGEVRNWERRSLGPQELLYSQIISTITALAYDISSKNEHLKWFHNREKEFDALTGVYSTFTELPSKLSSPISSILGAAQLIRKKVPFEAGELSRYNDIILKGANTIVKELNKFDDIRNNLKE
jgi:hypothetical protein